MLTLFFPGNSGLSLVGIIGIAVGGFLLSVLACHLLICCIKRKQKDKEVLHTVEEKETHPANMYLTVMNNPLHSNFI